MHIGEDTIQYDYDETNQVISFSYQGKTYYYEKDILGNINAILDKEGKTIVRYQYDGYGNHQVYDENDEENKNEDFIGNINPFRYRGYVYDVETQLFYCNSRYYSPELCRFIQPADVSSLNPSNINGLNLYTYADNNPISIIYNTSSISGSVNSGMVSESSFSLGGTMNGTSNPLTFKFPSQNWVSIGADLAASLSGVLSVISWSVKNLEFYDFLYSAYGISKFEMLDNLKSPLTKGAKALSYLLVLHDVGSDVVGHINAGDSWQTTTASGVVIAGVGVLNIWASTKIGAAIGGTIGGVPGLIIGTVGGAVVGVVINGIFYTEINGESIAGHIEDGIEWFLELF